TPPVVSIVAIVFPSAESANDQICVFASPRTNRGRASGCSGVSSRNHARAVKETRTSATASRLKSATRTERTRWIEQPRWHSLATGHGCIESCRMLQLLDDRDCWNRAQLLRPGRGAHPPRAGSRRGRIRKQGNDHDARDAPEGGCLLAEAVTPETR